jgi:hypothetical protein
MDKSRIKFGFIHFTLDLSKFYPGFIHISPWIYPYFIPDLIHILTQIVYILSQINLLNFTSMIITPVYPHNIVRKKRKAPFFPLRNYCPIYAIKKGKIIFLYFNYVDGNKKS